MERIKHEEMETAGPTETTSRSPVSVEKDVQIIPEEYPTVKLEPDMQDEFHAVMDAMQCEETGQFQTVYIKPGISSENDIVPGSGQCSEFSRVLLQSTDDKPTLCRLCATRGNDMIHMLGQNELYGNVIEKIDHCLPIMVRETDTLPKQACRTCLEKLELCYQFHNTVAEAEKQLLMLDEQASKECCETLPLFNSEEPKFEEDDRYSALKSAVSLAHSGDELKSNDKVSGSKNDSSPVTGNIQASDSRSAKARRDKHGGDILHSKQISRSKKIPAKGGNEFGNKFVSKLKQKLSKLYHNSSAEPHPVSGDHLRTEESLGTDLEENNLTVGCDFCMNRFHPEVLEAHKEACGSRILRTEENLFSCAYFCRDADGLLGKQESESEKTLAKSGDEFENKFVSQLKQKLNKLYHKSNIEPHSVSEDQSRTDESHATHPKKNNLAVKCTNCWGRFHSELLEVHKETCGKMFGTEKKLYSCKYCGKEFSREKHVHDHVRTHTGERPFVCGLCGERFKSKRTRNSHFKMHKGQRLFKCLVCDKTFKKACALHGHARCHSHKIHCPLCTKTFKLESRRNRHMAKTHVGEQPASETCAELCRDG